MKVRGGQPTTTWKHGFVRAPDLDQIKDGSKTLKPGHQGPAVLEVKRLFNQIGANNPKYVSLVENENFDRELLAKVSNFQSNHPELFSRSNHGNVTRGTLRALRAAARGREIVDTDPIPTEELPSSTGFWYEVQPADRALDRIAKRFKLESYLDLVADDHNRALRANPHQIKVGQKVWIPVDAPPDSIGGANEDLARPPNDDTTVIRPGETNPLVENIRAILRKLGYKGPLNVKAGNEYDHTTEVGVLWYQANFDSYRGGVDGVVGPAVWDGFTKELGVAPDKKPTELLDAPRAATPAPSAPLESGVRTSVSTTLSRLDTVHIPATPFDPHGGGDFPIRVPVETYATIVELPALRRRISRGKRGFDVEMAQRVLNMLGADPPLDVDASAGPAFQRAVLAYQRSRNLEKVTGVIEPETWAKFAQELEDEPPARSDISFAVETDTLTEAKQINALRTLQVLGMEDPVRARRLADFAGVTPGDPLVVDRNLVEKVAALADAAGIPLDMNRGAGDVSYASARVFMTLLEPAKPYRGLGVARGDGRASTRSLDKTRHDATIVEIANRYDVDPALVKAVMKTESNFNMTRNGSTLTSAAGALGLMQLMPDTAKGLGVNPYSVEGNIEGGVKYLARQLRKYDGDILKVAAAYNAGPGAVDKYNGVPPYRETMAYVRKIQAAYEYYKATGQP